jgi:hypothetical protein
VIDSEKKNLYCFTRQPSGIHRTVALYFCAGPTGSVYFCMHTEKLPLVFLPSYINIPKSSFWWQAELVNSLPSVSWMLSPFVSVWIKLQRRVSNDSCELYMSLLWICCLLWIDETKTNIKPIYEFGGMKNYKLRDLHASHTLGWSWNWNT